VTGRETPRSIEGGGLEDLVERYLREHPDFLERHPELVELLRVPHACGGAVSLIEYQVDTLKRQCREFRSRLSSLVDTARGNEELAARLHRLVLALMESPALDEIFTTLYQGLEEGFGADLVALRVFADPVDQEDRGLAELVGSDSLQQGLFGALFDARKPECGRPRPEVARWLFGERAAHVASSALLPLSIGRRNGVLAIGSTSATRFQPSMGTVYLRQLADVLGRLLAPRVR
jgi:uncharacterized protein YigA (DUF484 family)